MRNYQMDSLNGIGGIGLHEMDKPTPAVGEVLVRVKASSLNARDLSIANGHYPLPVAPGRVPLSDGAGVVEAIGEGVSRFAVGDRVVNSYLPTWFGGLIRSFGEQYGVERDGWLTEYIVVHEEGLVSIPDHLSFEEAATLPCAAVTAWSALDGIGAGDTLLVQGSGGVSVFALQLARAAGARVIATTSNDTKAARLLELGASDVVNYTTTTEWGTEVRALTGGTGVDRIVEVGGNGTISQSIAAIAFRGNISLVGQLSGSSTDMDLMSFFFSGATLTSIGVGSRSDFEQMNRVISQHRIHPVIDQVFTFEQAGEAWAHLESGSRFGKIVISH